MRAGVVVVAGTRAIVKLERVRAARFRFREPLIDRDDIRAAAKNVTLEHRNAGSVTRYRDRQEPVHRRCLHLRKVEDRVEIRHVVPDGRIRQLP